MKVLKIQLCKFINAVTYLGFLVCYNGTLFVLEKVHKITE